MLKIKDVSPTRGRSLKKSVILYLPEFISGGVSGAITTFALLITALSAHFSVATLGLLVLVNIVANGLTFSLRAALQVRPLRKKGGRKLSEEERFRKVLESRLRAQGLQSGVLHRSLSAIMELPEFSNGKINFYPQPAKSPLLAALTSFWAFALLGLWQLAGCKLVQALHPPTTPLLFCAFFILLLGLALIAGVSHFFPNNRPWRIFLENTLLALVIGTLAFGLGQIVTHFF